MTAAGTGLTSALGARMDHQARVTYERTRDRIAAIEERGKFDEDQLRREVEQTGTIVKGFLDAAQDHAEEIDWYADLLAGLVSTDRPDEPLDSAVLLSCVSRLEASSLALARRMYETWRRDTYAAASGTERPKRGPDTDYHLQHLEAEGLIRPLIAELVGSGAGQAMSTTYRYDLTPTLHRLVATLEGGRAGQPPTP